MTSQGTAHGRFQRAIHRRHVQAAEMAAREMGGLSLGDALSLCELLANVDPARYERAALRWLQRFIDERLPPLAEVALAASALAELRHGTGTSVSRRLNGCSAVANREKNSGYPVGIHNPQAPARSARQNPATRLVVRSPLLPPRADGISGRRCRLGLPNRRLGRPSRTSGANRAHHAIPCRWLRYPSARRTKTRKSLFAVWLAGNH
jgi:hypothetical protein